MVKISFELPVAYLEDFPSENHYIIAPWVISSKRYHDFYKAAKGYKILDNGAFEGAPMEFQDLMKIARDLRVDVVVLPDYLRDYERTWKALIQIGHISKIVQHQFKWMIVPQASSAAWHIAYNSLIGLAEKLFPAEQLVVGMPVWLDREPGISRRKLFDWMTNANMWRFNLPHHYLGISSLFEFDILSNHFESADTSHPIKMGFNLDTIDDFTISRRYERPAYFHELLLTAEQLAKAKQAANEMIKRWGS